MKKTAENRYPNSATLFRFCKNALELRYQGNVKVIDQDVGAILGYDPADCSHWKKGKKNIRSLSTIRTIAEHLTIDDRTLIDVTAGRTDLEEALFEYKGYGNFSLNSTALEVLKKEFFKDPTRWQKKEGVPKSFEELFDLDRKNIAILVQTLLDMGNFKEAPIYIPEVYQLFPRLHLETSASIDEAFKTEMFGTGGDLKTTVRIKAAEMKPYTRFLAAKSLFKFLLESKNHLVSKFFDLPTDVHEVQANVFAGMLLIPSPLLAQEITRADCTFDLVQQLSGTFWVSKSLLNKRLSEHLENL